VVGRVLGSTLAQRIVDFELADVCRIIWKAAAEKSRWNDAGGRRSRNPPPTTVTSPAHSFSFECGSLLPFYNRSHPSKSINSQAVNPVL